MGAKSPNWQKGDEKKLQEEQKGAAAFVLSKNTGCWIKTKPKRTLVHKMKVQVVSKLAKQIKLQKETVSNIDITLFYIILLMAGKVSKWRKAHSDKK